MDSDTNLVPQHIPTRADSIDGMSVNPELDESSGLSLLAQIASSVDTRRTQTTVPTPHSPQRQHQRESESERQLVESQLTAPASAAQSNSYAALLDSLPFEELERIAAEQAHANRQHLQEIHDIALVQWRARLQREREMEELILSTSLPLNDSAESTANTQQSDEGNIPGAIDPLTTLQPLVADLDIEEMDIEELEQIAAHHIEQNREENQRIYTKAMEDWKANWRTRRPLGEQQ
ncbi:UNVERIFIED_CONTAM: hypothetical protein HDU68_012302 [Siphonaria sp. JEL0065]|nr:hypothetical protein HDU68_012302 [Siphonaria sp. JEL0065]